MLFNSLEFLIFFPIVLLVYYVLPQKVRYIWLLVASYYFYMCWNVKYVLLLLMSTVITYVSGLLIDKYKNRIRTKKIIVALSLITNLGILFFFKYVNFALALVTKVFSMVDIDVYMPNFDIILPVGISFYTFQALSYTIDVYRGDIYSEKNFARYALFVSFFPQLVAGPIERSKNLLIQLSTTKRFNYEKAKEGFLLMLWGFFLKLVLADRIAMFVDTVYGDVDTYQGILVLIATVLFAFQIYCDFAGYSTIAMGAAMILDIRLMENFSAPYLATSVSDFWRRWHISLTSWFKDYLYIPLGGNRKGRLRKYLNQMIVFLVSGIWHGASLSFAVWGGLNGMYQVIGDLLKPIRKRLCELFDLNRNSFGHRLLSGLVTFVLIDFSWIFFRAQGIGAALKTIRSIYPLNNFWVIFDGTLFTLGVDSANFVVMFLSLGALVFADICKNRKICIRKVILEQDWWFRCLTVTLSVLVIFVFGVWGNISGNTQFIYFQF